MTLAGSASFVFEKIVRSAAIQRGFSGTEGEVLASTPTVLLRSWIMAYLLRPPPPPLLPGPARQM